MSARVPRPRSITRALALLLLTVPAACGPKRNEFAPVCPRPAFLSEASQIDSYRVASTAGATRDFTNLIIHGRVANVAGSCKPGSDKNHLSVTVVVGLEVSRGPAMQGRQATLPYFVAVLDGDRIIDKSIYNAQIEFPANVDRLFVGSSPIELSLPISPAKSGAAYTILSGFQLTPAELAAGRPGP